MTTSNEPDTDELVRRAADGSAGALRQLFGRHRNRLRRMVAVRMDDRLASRVDPSDVVQEVLLDASQRLAGYARQRPLPFYPWLRQIAWDRLRKIQQQHRRQKRSISRDERLLPDRSAVQLVDRLIDPGTGPNQRLLREEMRQRIHGALAQLSARDREVIVMRHLEQMQVGEIAAVLGISEGAVKMRRLRAIERLRELLDAGSERSES